MVELARGEGAWDRNMGLREVHSDVGFADGEILRVERSASSAAVIVKAWNERELRVEFDGVHATRDFVAGDIAGLFVHDAETGFLKDALAFAYSTKPTTHSLKHFVFVTAEDYPCLEVVAEGVRVCVA